MNQRLIVEGNDGWALTQLCKSNELPMPAGFSEKTIGKFVTSAGGYDNIHKLLEAALLEARVTNIGVVVDANEAGPAARWSALRPFLEGNFSTSTLDAASTGAEGIVLQEPGRPIVGVWIMPDNRSNGYLEHFLSQLIDAESLLWRHADQTVADLSRRHFCRFHASKHPKALLHTWLAWQESPGRPFGTAMQAGYLDATSSAAQPFLSWMKNTFQLST